MNYYYNCYCYYANSPSMNWSANSHPLSRTLRNHGIAGVIGHTAVAVKCNLAPGGIANLAPAINGPLLMREGLSLSDAPSRLCVTYLYAGLLAELVPATVAKIVIRIK